jgi:hypothetical protein
MPEQQKKALCLPLLHEESGAKMAPSDSWSVATGQDSGQPLIFRIRNPPPSFARKEEFPHLLAVSWPYESPNVQGMPSPDVVRRMTRFEDLLLPALEGSRLAFLTAIVTGNGVREWQWYAHVPEDVMKLVNETLGELEPFPVQFSFQDDPLWVGYRQFLKIIA